MISEAEAPRDVRLPGAWAPRVICRQIGAGANAVPALRRHVARIVRVLYGWEGLGRRDVDVWGRNPTVGVRAAPP